MIDVIIPTTGIPEFREAVQTIDRLNCRIICVLNGSGPDGDYDKAAIFVHETLKEWGGKFTLETFPARIGFVTACNIAFDHAETEIIACCNDDISGKSGWVIKLANTLNSLARIGQAGPSLRNLHNNGLSNGASRTGYQYLEGWCFAVKSAAIHRDHLFDPLFINGYCEDVDLSVYLIEEGWDLEQVRCNLIHKRRCSFAKTNPETWFWKRNREYLLRKWSIR